MKSTIGEFELLDRVEPLWNELNLFHSQLNSTFSSFIKNRSFEERRAELKQSTENIRIEIISDQEDVGYCICTISENEIGEIDSLYIQDSYRSRGLGKSLVLNALEWLDENNISKRKITVLDGNTEALKFYAQFGFTPRNIELEQVKQD